MPFFNRVRSLFSRSKSPPQRTFSDAEAPTPQEMQAALSRLDELATKAVLGEIGGGKPQKDNRATSWWGGNFLGAKD